MEGLIDIGPLREGLEAAVAWLGANAFVLGNVVQAAVILVAFLIARLVNPAVHRQVEKWAAHPAAERYIEPALRALMPLTLPVIWLVLQWLSVLVAARAGWPHHLSNGVVSLLTAWVVIRLVSRLIRNAALSRGFAVLAWTVAALNLFGWLEPTSAFLDSLAFQAGEFRLSLLGLVKAVVALAFLLWFAGFATRLTERALEKSKAIDSSARVLFAKLARIALFTFAILIGLDSVGIDLTALAVFTGAVGIGIGFGLQKVFANLISGVILLLDKSVKPGDVIALGTTFGWINSLRARYVSVITRDGTEHLIPNEELISQRVENWSFSHRQVRVRLPIGIAYESDPKLAMELAVQAGKEDTRVLNDPEPVCRLIGFGASSVDLELRIWVEDPEKGIGNVKSAVLLRVWELYHEHGVEFPYPQQDLHLKSSVPLEVRAAPGEG